MKANEKLELIMNTVFGWTFGILAAVATYGAVFCGATQQIFLAVISVVACMAFHSENRKIKDQSNHVH